MKKSAGFTLVEFIIVLVMIGILGIIAIPIYKSRTVKNEALKLMLMKTYNLKKCL